MSFVIKNKTPSVLTLAPLRDLLGNYVTLQPAGKKGDETEIDEHTLHDPIAERVYKAGWIDVKPPQHAQPQQQPSAPTPAPQATPTPMPPRSEPPPPPASPEPPPPLPPPEATPVPASELPATPAEPPTLDTAPVTKPEARPSKPTKR